MVEQITVKAYRQNQTIKQLSDVHNTFIISGRKNEVIDISALPANLSEKTGRQLFAKVPGAFIYDMDGSGNQINVSTRGLDAHRSWEFNIRQNGVIINSDLYGYPASHYSPPMESVKNIEIVRGTAALQYGAGFGGMINYVSKRADTTQAIGIESINSVGSFGLLSSYNSIGGKIGKFTYFGYFQKRVSEGYRRNGRSSADAQFLSLTYDVSDKLQVKAELGRSYYLYRIPGPLTDSMFYADPRQASRSRNYYSPEIYVPSLTIDYKSGTNTKMNLIISGVFGDRSSVLFEGFADKKDVIDPATNQYAARIVDIDRFNSKTAEFRVLHSYRIGNAKAIMTSGLRYFNNNMSRRQRGIGSTGTDFDLSVTGQFGRDLYYKSNSLAFSVENLIYITENFSVSPGFRYEYGQTDMTGNISYIDPNDFPNQIKHRIPVFGFNTQLKINETNSLYGSISQAYRPVLFKDIIPGSILERANKDLKNAYGYNAEIGYRGYLGQIVKFDITVFDLSYNNRLGNLVSQDSDGSNYILKTNIGDSRTYGLECYAEIFPFKSELITMSIFTASSLMNGRYSNGKIALGAENIDISGKRIESVPEFISRNGFSVGYKGLTSTLQYSYVSSSFSNPNNTIIPSINGSNGLVPSYSLLDFNMALSINSNILLRIGINNILNKQYFTKRPQFYPGPGVWSSDGRGIFLSFGVKI
ncbi:MAG: TonB-dependent receptor [Saprospiraceae bacterium]|nr:TonB-dependent receptor [Saprospiraceae bacterium]